MKLEIRSLSLAGCMTLILVLFTISSVHLSATGSLAEAAPVCLEPPHAEQSEPGVEEQYYECKIDRDSIEGFISFDYENIDYGYKFGDPELGCRLSFDIDFRCLCKGESKPDVTCENPELLPETECKKDLLWKGFEYTRNNRESFADEHWPNPFAYIDDLPCDLSVDELHEIIVRYLEKIQTTMFWNAMQRSCETTYCPGAAERVEEEVFLGDGLALCRLGIDCEAVRPGIR